MGRLSSSRAGVNTDLLLPRQVDHRLTNTGWPCTSFFVISDHSGAYRARIINKHHDQVERQRVPR